MKLDLQQVLILLNLPRIGRKKVQKLIYPLSSSPCGVVELEKFYSLIREQVSPTVTFSQLQIAFSKTQKLIAELERLEIKAIVPSDQYFPRQLTTIPDPPVILYAKGNLEILSGPNLVALVGTRNATPFGDQIGYKIAKTLAQSSFTVVSGLALGSDTTAHRGCLMAKNGKTVAVLSQGLDKIYPKQNAHLADEILERGGCLVSEYAPGFEARAYTFVERNRLQSGLSRGVIVVETGETGGTMHTVNFAKKQNRPLACVSPPASHISAANKGNQRLLRNGAYPIKCANDVYLWLDKKEQKTPSSFALKRKLDIEGVKPKRTFFVAKEENKKKKNKKKNKQQKKGEENFVVKERES